MNKYIIGLLVIISGVLNRAFALTVETVNLQNISVPAGSQANRISPITADPKSYLNIINIANDYLRFGLAAVCVGVLIYVGIKLMTAQGDKSKMQQANRALVGLVVGLAIAYFSYTIIRMVANWF